MSLIERVTDKVAGELGKIMAKWLVEHPLLGYFVTLIISLAGGVVVYKKGDEDALTSAITTLATYLVLYYILNLMKRFVVGAFKEECNVEPCSSVYGVKCSKVNPEYLVKCIERLAAQSGADVKIRRKKCILKRNSKVMKMVEEALNYVKEGDYRSAREVLGHEIEICL